MEKPSQVTFTPVFITQQTSNKMWSLPVVEYYSSIKKIRAHTATQMSHENTPRQKASHNRPCGISFSLPELSGTGKSVEVESSWVAARR